MQSPARGIAARCRAPRKARPAGARPNNFYKYDNKGNQTLDKNKGISSITYNHLNLPVEITFNSNANTKITYLYTATGEKVQKAVKQSAGAAALTNYISGFQYKNTTLDFFPVAGGYVKNTVLAGVNYYNYVFHYLDHLGNIRLSYAKNVDTGVKILEENHYYPYGLKHTNYNTDLNAFKANEMETAVVLKAEPVAASYPYKFNGMEWQDELGLNLYDMDMRDYDPAIGRWTGIDPVTHFDQSTYMAMNGNPVFFADPSGADGLPPEGINTWHYAGGNSFNSFLNGGAGNLSNGDHMFGGSGNSFWGGQTAYTGGDMAWANYNIANGIQTFYGGQARTVFSYLATVNGWTSYMYPDSESTVPGGMGVGMYQKKAPSYLDNYFAGYFNGVNSGEFGPSSMISDASGFSINLSVNTGLMGQFYINAGFAASRTNEVAFFGGFGGNFGWNGGNGIPSFSGGLTYDMHNNFGGNQDVLGGLGGTNKGYFAGAGYLNGSYSKSSKHQQGWVVDKSGVSTLSIGLGFGLGAGMEISNGGVWRPFK